MKKKYIGLFLMSCFFVAFSTHATEATGKLSAGNAQVTSGQTTMDVNIDAEAFSQKSALIQKVDLNFCEAPGAKSVRYEYDMGSNHELCYTVVNFSDQDVAVNVAFVDGMLTNDEWKNKACGATDNIDNFGKYVTGYKTQLLLRKGDSKTAHAQIHLPKDAIISGSTIYGCLVYSLVSDDEAESVPLGVGIVVRKAKFIDLHIQKGPSLDRRSLLLIVALLAIGYRIYRKKFFSSKGK